RDLPYDQFLKLQLAADKVAESRVGLAPPSTQPSAAALAASSPTTQPTTQPSYTPDLVALGFLGLGPKYYSRNRLDVMAEEWEDRVDTVSRTMLGLTVACAKCHDHKFDPIHTRDYYALAGIFASTKMVNRTAGGVEVKGDMKAEQ